MGHRNPKPYATRTDLEKIQSQWNKITGHQYREDWSAAVVRAATAAEIAVNFSIRREFAARSKFGDKFVDSLLMWANGISGKVKNLLMPLLAGQPNHGEVDKLRGLAESINNKRNSIAHRGEFASEEEATELIAKCREFVLGLVRQYEKSFDLIERPMERDSGEQDP